ALLQDVVSCQQALARLSDVLDAKAGEHAPSFRQAREALEAVRALVERFVGKPAAPATVAGDAQQAAAPTAVGRVEAPAAGGQGAAAAGGPIRTRQQALAQLREVADFFRRTEPHSPVAYLAARAAKWGEMPLHAWL